MMWAPQSGEETRALLRDKAQDGIDEAVAQGKKVARKAQRAADSAREFVNDVWTRAKAPIGKHEILGRREPRQPRLAEETR
jgi:gas vesicle protein